MWCHAGWPSIMCVTAWRALSHLLFNSRLMTLILNPHRLVQPALEPVSLAEAKLFLRVEHDVEDTLIATLITTAREAAERLLGMSCIVQRWQWESVPFCGTLTLPFGPVRSIVEVAQRQREATSYSVLDSGAYALRGDTLVLQAAPQTGTQLRVIYEAGFGDEAIDVPATIRHALMRHIAALYDSRGTAGVVDLHPIYAELREVRI